MYNDLNFFLTGRLIPVGGSTVDPITLLPAPIEIGGIAFQSQKKKGDPREATLISIVGVHISKTTGRVVPIGCSSEKGIPVTQGMFFKNGDFGGLECRVGWAAVHSDGKGSEVVVPCCNVAHDMLFAREVMQEISLLNAAENFIVRSEFDHEKLNNVKRNLITFDDVIEQNNMALSRCRRRARGEQMAEAGHIAVTGGVEGRAADAATGEMYPVLIGCPMW